MPVLAFDVHVVARRCGEAPSRGYPGVTPQPLCARNRESQIMATQNLTVRSIEGLKPGRTRYEVFDALTPGLAIRVTPTGHKSWVLLYRYHGRLRRLTLGRYPDRTLA
jgi:Arm DNA-binding domain